MSDFDSLSLSDLNLGFDANAFANFIDPDHNLTTFELLDLGLCEQGPVEFVVDGNDNTGGPTAPPAEATAAAGAAGTSSSAAMTMGQAPAPLAPAPHGPFPRRSTRVKRKATKEIQAMSKPVHVPRRHAVTRRRTKKRAEPKAHSSKNMPKDAMPFSSDSSAQESMSEYEPSSTDSTSSAVTAASVFKLNNNNGGFKNEPMAM